MGRKRLLVQILGAVTALAILSTAVLAVEGGGEETPEAESSTDAQQEQTGTEVSLEELRDELLAIVGGGEESAALQVRIDRMIALGDPNGTLRTYLEGMIRLNQLQYETQQLQSQLDGLAAADQALGEIGDAVLVLENPDEALRRVGEELDQQAADLLETAGYDGTGDLAALVSRSLGYLDGKSAGASSADAAAILLFTGLQDGGFLDEAGLATAQDAVSAHFANILGRYQGLASGTRQSLKGASQAIAGRANKAGALDAGVLVVAGETLELTHPVFTYGDTIMISIADAAVYLDGQVLEMEGNDTVVIQADGVVLEMTKGSSDAYYNDRLWKMEQPVLLFDGVCYLPLDTMLHCCGMERMTIDGYELLYPAP